MLLDTARIFLSFQTYAYDLADMDVEFSVVIPTFRRPHFLLEAISSSLRQRDVSVELIVVDDCPEGSAEAPVRELRDPRVRYFRNPNPTGGMPSKVRNIGWPLARGKFVHFLDDDDLVTEDHYIAVREAFRAAPAIGLVFGRIEPFGSPDAEQLDRERRYFAEAAHKSAKCKRFGPRLAYVGRMLFDNALLVCSASVIRREHIARIGGFDPNIRLMEDADYHVRAMRECGALFLNRVAIHYRVGNPSLMHSPNPGKDQRMNELRGRRQMQANYRNKYGALEFYSLALFTRTILAVL